MGLSRLDNFLKNTRGEIIYVDPSSLDSTDSIQNQGNSLARPFKTIQRALIESARFSYQRGRDNDRFGKTTILLYPGEHIVDNRPGWIPLDNNFYQLRNGVTSLDLSPFDTTTNFDLEFDNNALYKLNSIYGGVIVPRGTSIVGLDLRKTKIRPKYVPNPKNDSIERSAVFRVTGACYLWQFSIFDADPNSVCYQDYTNNTFVPNFSHHKLTCFEYADGVNPVNIDDDFISYSSDLTDLDMYYAKVGAVYGTTSGRPIPPETVDNPLDIEKKIDEYQIVGPRGTEVQISSIVAGNGELSSNIITVTLEEELPGLDVDSAIQIQGISVSGYNGQFVVSEVIDNLTIQYKTATSPINPSPSNAEISEATLTLVIDTVTSASPYIFNISLRSVYGMCGMHADGNKADGFKSMVVAQFTGISLQKDNNAFIKYNPTTGSYDDLTTTVNLYSDSSSIYKPEYESYHVKASNNAFIQIVSVFAIGYANQFLSESGGDLSITNSNSNFGAKSLISDGFRENSFKQDDCGYITHVIPPREIETEQSNIEFLSIDVPNTIGIGITSRLYLYEKNDLENEPENVIDGYRIGSRVNDQLELQITSSGITTTYNSTIVMPGTNTTYKKVFVVSKKSNNLNNEINSNIITLDTNHTLQNGESIVFESDTGELPGGLLSNQIYYAITSFSGALGNQIKVAKTLNDVSVNREIELYSNESSLLKVISKVSDKKTGEIGHPIQWDDNNEQWYISVSDDLIQNEIYTAILNLNVEATSRTYFKRNPDTRSLVDKIYRVRYVIPKDVSSTSRPPQEGFIIQDSSTVTSDTIEISKYLNLSEQELSNTDELRNFRFISNIRYDNGEAIIKSEIPHNLVIGNEISVKNVRSSLYPSVSDNIGYNGKFIVNNIIDKKTFTVSIGASQGTFINNTSIRNQSLPYFYRSKYSGTYYIYRSEEIQQYIKNVQDGIYYLILLNASNNPNISVFNTYNFSQPIQYLYPQTNRDSPDSDPDSSVSFALPNPIGEVVINDLEKSLTKETIEKTFSEFRLGIGLTDISSSIGGTIHTLYTDIDHGLNRITNVAITSSGFGYGDGTTQLIYNAPLVSSSSTITTGKNSTALLSLDTNGSIIGVKIIDGGSSYSVGDSLFVDVVSPIGVAKTIGFTSAILNVSSIYNNTNDVLDLRGVNSLYDEYNGLYRIVGVNTGVTNEIIVQSTNSISSISTTGIGETYIRNALLTNIGSSIKIQSLNYNSTTGIAIVTTLNQHGLVVNDKININGATEEFYNGDYIIKKVISQNVFTINIGVSNIVPSLGGSLYAYRTGFTSKGGIITKTNESIGGRLVAQYDNLTSNLAATINNPEVTSISISNITNLDLKIGDYLQIDNEIVRIRSTVDGNPISVFRGVLGTRRSSHNTGSVVRKIKPLPVELRRNSIIRASGHTFEYVGYGPGNYSTGFPERQDRQITQKEELLAQSTKSNGGSIAFTAMNSVGDFYIGNKKVSSSSGKEEVYDAPIPSVVGENLDINSGIDIISPQEISVERSIKIQGGNDSNIISEFNGPVIFNNKITSTSEKGLEVGSIFLKGTADISRNHSTANEKPTSSGTPGDIVYAANPDSGGTLGWVYTTDNRWEDFGLISEIVPLSRNVGVSSGGVFVGVSTTIDFVGQGVSITGSYDVFSGISTLNFFSSAVEPESLLVSGISTFQNSIISNSTLFVNGGIIANTGISTFNSLVRMTSGADIFNGLQVDTVTITDTAIITDLSASNFISTTSNFAGNISAGSVTRANDTLIKSLSGDNNQAGFEAHGDIQGTGYLYIGSRSSRGGGISYNGNLSPSFAIDEVSDSISFYRKTSNVNKVVFYYPHNSDDVTFLGNITAVNGSFGNVSLTDDITINGNISSVNNINSSGISTLPSINTDNVVVNNNLSIFGSVDQTVVSLGTSSVIDCSSGNYFTVTVNENKTFSFTNVPVSKVYGITIEVNHVSGSISWPSEVNFAENLAPILTTGKVHLFMFVTSNGGNTWRGAALIDFDS
jgi:hypothetical protein